jgi:hypothetical protein
MRNTPRQWWPVLKLLFTAAILFFVSRQVFRDLHEPSWVARPALHPGWLALAALLYLAGLGFSAFFWLRLLRMLGQQPGILRSIRAYYIGHLGKYIPGKAWALMYRATLAQSPGVKAGVAGATAFYEVLTTMASGALLAAILLWFVGPETTTGLDWPLLWKVLTSQERPSEAVFDGHFLSLIALILFGVIILPISPLLFNRMVRRLSLPFLEPGKSPLQVPPAALLEGLALTACGWLFLGTSLWAVFQSLSDVTEPLTWRVLSRDSAYLSLAYVLGFVILLAPGGLGIRESFLFIFLSPDVADLPGWEGRTAMLPVVVLRLVWTLAEAVIATVLYWLSGNTAGPAQQPETNRP